MKTTLPFDVAYLFLSTAVNPMVIVIYISAAHVFTSVHVVLYELVYVCSGIGRETPEDAGIATKTADGDSWRWADSMEETSTAGWQWRAARGRTGHTTVMVCTHVYLAL